MVADQAAPMPAALASQGATSTHNDLTEWGLQLKSVVKRYGTTVALRHVDLDVHRGEFMTILGPSGSGKTTLLRLIAGFAPLTSGQIMLGGRDVSTMSPAERGIGMVFQNYALFPHLTARANVEYGLKMRRWPRRARRERAEQMLELVGLTGKSDQLPRQLSGGQQQRVAVARALAFDPALLLMDEPLGALDRELRIRMAGELRRLHSELGTTVVYVTHDREEALTLSDRIAIVRDGSLESLDTPEQLFSSPNSSFTASFFGGHNLVPATVAASARDSDVEVETLGQRVRVRSAGEIAPGDEVALVVPALACSLAGESADAVTALSMCLRVDDVLYMGEFTQARGTVMVDAAATAESLNVHLSGFHVDAIPRGSVQVLTVDPTRCIAVPWSPDRRA